MGYNNSRRDGPKEDPQKSASLFTHGRQQAGAYMGYFESCVLLSQGPDAKTHAMPPDPLLKHKRAYTHTDVRIQGHQIWSDQVGSVHARTLYPRGVWGHALPGKILNLGAMRLLLRPILGQYDASWRPNDRVSHECHSAHCVVHHWCRLSDPVCLSAETHTLRRKLARLIVRTESC